MLGCATPPTRRTEPGEARPLGVSLRGFDPDSLAEVIRGGHFDACQLGAGRMEGEILQVRLEGAIVEAAVFDRDLGVRGRFPEDTWTLLVVQDAAVAPLVNAVTLRPGDLVVCPPAARIDAYLPASTRWLTYRVRGGGPRASGEGSPPDVTCFRPTPRRGSELRRRAAELLGTSTRELPKDGECQPAAIRVKTAAQDALRGAERLSPDGGASTCRRLEVVRIACDAMSDRLGHRLSIDGLCDLAGVSPRSLAYYFRQTLGVAPMAWFRAQRFAAARRALLRANGPAASVTAIATRYGFTHLGRFSVEYRARFGESPSETLTGIPRASKGLERPHRGREGGAGGGASNPSAPSVQLGGAMGSASRRLRKSDSAPSEGLRGSRSPDRDGVAIDMPRTQRRGVRAGEAPAHLRVDAAAPTNPAR